MSTTEVRFVFTHEGGADVISTFKSIGAAAQGTGKQVGRSAREWGDTTVKATDRVQTARERADEKWYVVAKREADKVAREAERAAKRQAQAHERALKHVAGIRSRYFEQQQREAERAARKQQREEERAAKRSERAAERIEAARRKRLVSMGSTAIKFGLGAVVSGGAIAGGIVGASARSSLKLGEIANRVSINARAAGTEAVDPRILQSEFQNTAIATPGIGSIDIAEAVQGFVTKTGNLDVARASQKTFATVASATGTDVRDVASAAAELFEKFDIKSVEEMSDALSALTFQGKSGAFELKDAAGKFALMASAAKRFGFDKGIGGVKTLGGLSQLAMKGTGNADRAATALSAMLRQLGKMDPTGKKNVQDLLVETIASAGGNKDRLQKIFGDEGLAGASHLIGVFNDSRNSTSGSEAQKTEEGLKAMRRALEEAINPISSRAELEKDAAQAQAAASAKLTAAWEVLMKSTTEHLVPTLLDLVPKLQPLAEGFANIIPLLGTMADVLGKVMNVAAEVFGDSFNPTGDAKGRSERLGRELTALESDGPATADNQRIIDRKRAEKAKADEELKFIQEFADKDTRRSFRADAEYDAKVIYDGIQKDPEGNAKHLQRLSTIVPGDTQVPFLAVPNQEQAKLVGNAATSVTAERAGAGQSIKREVDEVKTGLKDLAANLRNVGSANLLGAR